MNHLLISLALWMGAVGWGRTEPTDVLHRGLEVALETFHEHPPLEGAFRETAVTRALNMVSKRTGLGVEGSCQKDHVFPERFHEKGYQAVTILGCAGSQLWFWGCRVTSKNYL